MGVLRVKWLLVALGAIVLAASAALAVNQFVAPAPSAYLSSESGVAYYPACGSEPLDHEGLTWYPIWRDAWEGPSAQTAPSAQSAPGSGGRGIATVAMVAAPPGDGDDVGTLYVYPMGRAYWISESGDLDTWLTLVPRSYDWVC